MGHNRLATAKNPYQGHYKRVLCVCSGGLLRSPTAAFVLSQEPFGYNTRAAGVTDEYALIKIDEVLLHWADEIVCMEPSHAKVIRYLWKMAFGEALNPPPIIALDIEDNYAYRDPLLIDLIKQKYEIAMSEQV